MNAESNMTNALYPARGMGVVIPLCGMGGVGGLEFKRIGSAEMERCPCQGTKVNLSAMWYKPPGVSSGGERGGKSGARQELLPTGSMLSTLIFGG